MIFFFIFLTLFFLCWGSFLNVLAYRLINSELFLVPRSICIVCKKTIKSYDNLPIISFILLKGRCRYCHKKISYLYPVIEIFTTVVMLNLFLTQEPKYFFPYFTFFSALIITIRTDFEYMLISRFVTLFLIPIALILSYLDLLNINFYDSIIGAIFGYSLLFLIAKIFYLITKKEGLGQGDMDLLAFIGSFTGFFGVWYTLLIGSILGSIVGAFYIIKNKNHAHIIPFGPFLAFGAILYILLQI